VTAYLVFVTVAWVLLTAAQPLVYAGAFVDPGEAFSGENGLFLTLLGSLWLLLTHAVSHGLGPRPAFVTAVLAFLGLTVCKMFEMSTWTGSVPWGIGLLAILTVTVFVPVSTLLLALGLRWPLLLPLVALALAVPLVADLYFEEPWWLLSGATILFLLNATFARGFVRTRPQSYSTSRLASLFRNWYAQRLLTDLGAIATLSLVFALNVAIPWENWFLNLLYAILYMGPLAFMTGEGLWILNGLEE